MSSSACITTYQSLRIQLVQNAPDDGLMRSEICRANISAEWTYSLKTLCVSCWTAYILQDDTRSLQYQGTVSWMTDEFPQHLIQCCDFRGYLHGEWEIWRRSLRPTSRFYPKICLKELRETMESSVKIVSKPSKIKRGTEKYKSLTFKIYVPTC